MSAAIAQVLRDLARAGDCQGSGGGNFRFGGSTPGATMAWRQSTWRGPAGPVGPPSKAGAPHRRRGNGSGNCSAIGVFPRPGHCTTSAALSGLPLIASGGIRHGLDGAKAIRLVPAWSARRRPCCRPRPRERNRWSACAGMERGVAHRLFRNGLGRS